MGSYAFIRALLVYGTCVPLAVLLGYLLATPYDANTLIVLSIVLSLLLSPLFLRWHHAWLVASWNMTAMVFFLPGRPALWTALAGISFLISVLQYILNRRQGFLRAPLVARPLIFLTVVILATAYLTGGIGIKALGGESYGGKRYFVIFGAVLGYFAITSRQIPPGRAALYVWLYFLGGISLSVGNLAGIINPGFNFLFLIFPVDQGGVAAIMKDTIGQPEGAVTRISGMAFAGIAGFCAMLAHYGISGLMNPRRPFRMLAFVFFIVIGMFAGFRSMVITFMLTFALLFYLEGLMRSRLLPVLLLAGVLGAVLVAAFATHLPLSFQRALAFLPIEIDPVARLNAQVSSEWRVNMWKRVLPEVPQYLIIGKGYSIKPSDLEAAQGLGGQASDTSEGAEVAGDYHNGPLSVIIPFGLLGVGGLLWFFAAGLRAVYLNYRYGPPAYHRVNTFLYAYFAAKVFFFFTVFGSLYSDLPAFAGLLALSISLNGGVAKPATVPRPKIRFHAFEPSGLKRA
jgi:hypothetical protein